MDCESIEKIKENIYTYLSEIKGKKNPKLTYDIIINRINEITNSIFEIRIYYKTTNELYDRVIYKKFSKISKSCSNKIEQSIFNSLSKKVLVLKYYILIQIILLELKNVHQEIFL